MKIKILQSMGSLGMGGNELFAMNLFRSIDKEKFQVDFVVYDDTRMDFYDEIVNSGSKVYICKSKSKSKIGSLLSVFSQVKKILKNNKYDIIHCHSCSFVGLLYGALPGSVTDGVKVITHAHNPGTPKNTWIDNNIRLLLKKWISRLADMGFACSDLAGESKYTDRFIKSKRYMIINNAIDIDKYKFNGIMRKKIREDLNLRDDEYLIGHVGRFEYQKNHFYLIDIFEALYNKNNKYKLLLIGDGSLFNKVKDYTIEKNLSDSVIFLGQKDNAADYYSSMDCFLLPSHYEGFPFVLVEAQINGLRCVISDTVSQTVNVSGGVCFESLDASTDNWTKAIMDSCKSRLKDDEIKKVSKKYDLKRETKKIEKIYIYLNNK